MKKIAPVKYKKDNNKIGGKKKCFSEKLTVSLPLNILCI